MKRLSLFFLLTCLTLIFSINHTQADEADLQAEKADLQAEKVDLQAFEADLEALEANLKAFETDLQVVGTKTQAEETPLEEYLVGINDILQIDILRPEALTAMETVTPDGAISFPYIGTVMVKGKTLNQIQQLIQSKLADGYMKYPVVTVSLKESRSKKFFVYGEVVHPGSYPIEPNTTVLKAISIAGGFTKYGSSSNVKILRTRDEGVGYNAIKVKIRAIMGGDSDSDLILKSGDIVVVSEGIF